MSFFAFLNKQSVKSERIDLNSKDEFGEMSYVINENIQKTERLISQDNQLIDNVKKVVEDVKQGKLNSKITSFLRSLQKALENKEIDKLKSYLSDLSSQYIDLAFDSYIFYFDFFYFILNIHLTNL